MVYVCFNGVGMRTDGPKTSEHDWLNNGYEGVDFACNLQYADFATVHSYPDAWGMSANGGYKWLGENYYKDRMEVANAAEKPIILEEYGMRRGYLPTRDTLFEFIQNQVNSLGYACTIVWSVSHEPTTQYQYGYYGYNDGQGYVFGYTGADTDGSNSVQNQYKYTSSLYQAPAALADAFGAGSVSANGPFCTDKPPNKKLSCASQVVRGNCNTQWMIDGSYCEYSCGRCK